MQRLQPNALPLSYCGMSFAPSLKLSGANSFYNKARARGQGELDLYL